MTFAILVALVASVVLVEVLSFFVPEKHKISSNYLFFMHLYPLHA